jgi:tetratricopeptide (TPR) repeat protein
VRSMRPCLLIAGTVLLALGITAPGTGTAQPDERLDGVVQDLAYGEVLFHFYEGDYFAALTRLMAAQARGEFSHHAIEAELLLGGLHLSYGQHQRAAAIFERLLAQSVQPALHDRAWYFLAKIWYQRGYWAEAERALARIADALPPELESEHQLLRAQVLMAQDHFDDALGVLADWREPEHEWVGYAKYNIGVALLRLDRAPEGAAVLTELGMRPASDEVTAGLRDKANVALGYAWLQAGEPAAAKPALQRVRLNGPFSNEALLGVGWADAALQRPESALVPWLELRSRGLADTAVQEALLAVPYAYAELGATGQAAEAYESAIRDYQAEIERLDAAMQALHSGQAVDSLLAHAATDRGGWYWQLDRLPDSAASRRLYDLVATHEFQEALKNYRDLAQLRASLVQGADDLVVFDDILLTRQRAYEQRLPVVVDGLARLDVEDFNHRRVELESRLAAIEAAENGVALGTAREQALWADLAAVEAGLARLGTGPGAEELAAKQRFLKGLLQWDLERDYKARLWQARRELRELDEQARQARRRYHAVDQARAEWPERFAALSERVGDLEPRVVRLESQVAEALSRQQALLQALAIGTLEARRERLESSLVQARFALAALYDRVTGPPTAGVSGSTGSAP